MEDEMKVVMVHPETKKEVIATHPQQVAAFVQQGFVEKADEQSETKERKGNR